MNCALNVRVRQCCTLYLSVEVCEFEIEKSAGEAAKPEVRTQACGAGQQGISIHSGTLEISHPSLQKKQKTHKH